MAAAAGAIVLQSTAPSWLSWGTAMASQTAAAYASSKAAEKLSRVLWGTVEGGFGVLGNVFKAQTDSKLQLYRAKQELGILPGVGDIVANPVDSLMRLSVFAKGDVYRFTAGAFSRAYNTYLANQTKGGSQSQQERLYFPAENVEPINVDQHALQTEKILDMLDTELGFMQEALKRELPRDFKPKRKEEKLGTRRRAVEGNKGDLGDEDLLFLNLLPALAHDRYLTREEYQFVDNVSADYPSARRTEAYLRASAKYRPR